MGGDCEITSLVGLSVVPPLVEGALLLHCNVLHCPVLHCALLHCALWDVPLFYVFSCAIICVI